MAYQNRNTKMWNINIWLKRYSLLIWIFFMCTITLYIGLQQNQNEIQSPEGTQIFQKKIDFLITFFLSSGRFWVFSDSHVDILYRSDGDPANRCRNASQNNMRKIIRKFGHFDCDAPMNLVMSAFSAAKKLDSDIDFIIWLG